MSRNALSERSARSVVHRRRGRALLVFLYLDGASLLWSWLTAEAAEDALGSLMTLFDSGTRALLFGAALAMLLSRRPRVVVGLRRSWRRLRRVWFARSIPGRAGVVLALGLAAWSVGDYAWAPIDGHQRRVASASVRVPGVHPNEWNDHVPALVEALALSPGTEPVVVDIDDGDPRGNQASYYAYPRLLVMEPSLRKWSLRSRQYALGVDDLRGSGPPVRPAPEVSLDYASERKLPLVRVTVSEDEESGEPIVALEWTR